jgi:uncharacterized integral membrane protein
MLFSLIVIIAVAIAAVIFSSYNTAVVDISLFGFMVSGPLGLILIIALSLGVLIGVILMTPGAIKNQVIVSRHKKQLAKMEQPPVKPVEKSKPLEE